MGKKAIIFVDDDPLILQSIKSQLRASLKEYLIEYSDSAEEALEIVEELLEDGIEIHSVISDWNMPEMKGDELLRIVHSKLSCNKVLLTGMADNAAIEEAQSLGALNTCVPKPWDKDQLLNAILAA